jgi:hypothetical protein
VVLASSPFYTSGTFWAGAGTVAGVLGTIATLWVTMRVAYPKRLLFYSMEVVATPGTWLTGPYREAKVIAEEKELKWPCVVNVELASKGRFDIAREAFDSGDPMRLDVGATIVECMNVATSPSDRPELVWKIEGTALLIGPCLIGRRQTTVFSLLVAGLSPHLAKPAQSLTDVKFLSRYVLGGFLSRRDLLICMGYLIPMIVLPFLFLFGAVHGTVKDILGPIEWILVIIALVFAFAFIAEWFSEGGWSKGKKGEKESSDL